MLSDAGIRAAVKRGEETTLRDDGRRGEGRLVFMLRPPLAEWYAARYIDGRRRLSKLGNYPAMSLAEARRAFREAPEKRSTATLKELAAAYLANIRSKRPASVAKTLTYIVDAIGPNRPLADITPAVITDALRRVHLRGSASHADRQRAAIRAAFAWALAHQFDYTAKQTREWGITSNPAASIPRDAAASRVGQRFLSDDEFRSVYINWMYESRATWQTRFFLVMHMLTGQRVEEVVRARYEGGWMYLDDTKTGRPHAIPLPRQAIELLAKYPAGKPTLSAMMAAKHREFGTSFALRDIRRTWKTLAGRAGISKELRDLWQNHAKADVSAKHYDRYDYAAEKVAACKLWEAYLDQLLGSEGGAGSIRQRYS